MSDQPVDLSKCEIEGFLVTMRDGHKCRLGPDQTRAELFAAQNHATIKPMFVQRDCRL